MLKCIKCIEWCTPPPYTYPEKDMYSPLLALGGQSRSYNAPWRNGPAAVQGTPFSMPQAGKGRNNILRSLGTGHQPGSGKLGTRSLQSVRAPTSRPFPATALKPAPEALMRRPRTLNFEMINQCRHQVRHPTRPPAPRPRPR